ncbi:hypothetical protein ATN81_14960 [Agrobacterium pusense]|uniref:hypothetical protein n=1 Tax=Agrobacterium pusense TaxID=648995 RepID=UPI000929ECD2|nr:hypothetical protein [Agrobacterium pusense]OJH54168.1 hypothetical protein ATN81_14960 [Agrobacterium pusense]OJH58582.1 hypothetical protein BA725_16690 [Agrobacterium pusense]
MRLTFAGSELIWAGAPRPGLPILRWQSGMICEPVLYYFGHSAEKRRVKISSMPSEAYTIREWIVYLANRGLTVFDASNKLMEEYRTSQGWVFSIDRKGRKKANPADLATNFRIETKLHRIFEFYRHLPMAMPIQPGGEATQTFVGENNGPKIFPIGSKMAFNRRKKKNYPVWVGSSGVKKLFGDPRIPSKATVARVYAQLRGKGFREQQRLKLAFPPEKAEMQGIRNWLLARTIVGGGLRCKELSELTVHQIAKALVDSGITRNLLDLDFLADDPVAQQELVGKILSRKRGTEHASISVHIDGKGDNPRHAPFEPSLIADILVHGVWNCRKIQLAEWRESNPRLKVPSFVFLSHQSFDKLDPGSIGDIIGKAFRALGLEGSAHKLRGYYATVLASELWKQYFARYRYRFDNALVNDVMNRVATALGHQSVTTTIKFYVSEPLFAHLTKIGTPAALLFQQLWDIVVMTSGEISERKAKLMLDLMTELKNTAEDSKLMKILEHVSNDPSLISHPQARRNRKPTLAFIADNDKRDQG